MVAEDGVEEVPQVAGDVSLPPAAEGGLQLGNQAAEDLAVAQDDADRAARLLADQELFNEMAADGFAGPKFELWSESLMRYSIAVLHAQLITGLIWGFAAQKGRPAVGATLTVRQRLAEDQEARQDLVHLLLAQTWKRFYDHALQESQWTADGGASLQTYFIGAAHLQLSTTFREWRKNYPDPDPARRPLPDPDAGSHGRRSERPDTAIIDQAEKDAMLALAPAGSRDVVVYRLDGYSHAEIAELTNRTERAVEGVIHRYRKTLERHGYF
ncbi:sigma factor-like helix-turn-helix DNA-binding protein [uncultured Serinicoccus sp.]|uniref:RNA polymerase sigma factor n=1 Tax=uncultured Serinicoccus sp. TaxID=735514 RepID=UPI002625A712|nr:sigma factor-like helix-turn-helix DNA-binding protein [uncultured Serinicoccus sp.]